MLQGSIIGTWTGAKQVEETLHAFAWSCGVPSIMPDGELESKYNILLASPIHFLPSESSNIEKREYYFFNLQRNLKAWNVLLHL